MRFTLLRFPCPFLDGLRQSFLKKAKHLLTTAHWPWLVPFEVPLLLGLPVLWGEVESPGPHWEGGLGVAFLSSGLGGEVAVPDSDSTPGWDGEEPSSASG